MNEPGSVRKLGEHLVGSDALRPEQVEALLEEQRQTAAAGVHSRLGEIAVRRGWVEADLVTAALRAQAADVIDATDTVAILLGMGWITDAAAREVRARADGSGESLEEAAAELRVADPGALRQAGTLALVRSAGALRLTSASSFAPWNVLELIVAEEVNAALRTDSLCACTQCWSNVYALALNAMPVRYVSDQTRIFDFYRRFREEYGPLAHERVAAALAQVRANPKAACWSRFSDDIIAGREKDDIVQEVVVRVSARHVHLDAAAMAALFGGGRALTKLKDLAQPGQFAANETVAVAGPKGTIDKVRVLGPLRPETQVEISGTDQFALGVQAPVRESGKLDGTPGIRLRGPAGEITLARGLIRALRHIHMAPADADSIGAANGGQVSVRLVGDRTTIVEGVLVRVSPSYVLEMHIDTDEANASGVPAESKGQILTPLRVV
jgi:putative phosphotransacetylase